MPNRIAYLPLDTHPEAAPDPAILAAIAVAAGLGCRVAAGIFAVKVPSVASPLGAYLINIEGMARVAEERSRAEARRLQALVEAVAGPDLAISVTNHQATMGGTAAAAAADARCFDLCVVPWSAASVALQDLAQALVFGSGLPVILVPSQGRPGPFDHIAIAWDESRVAARALHDALPFLAAGGRVSVLTVHGEKALEDPDIARTLATSLVSRGYDAEAVDLSAAGKSVAEALQDGAVAAGAQLLAMGGFGHSRLRDFILGGATKGILSDLRIPVLMSH